MKITIPNNYIHILLFAIAVFFSYTTNFELQFLMWFGIACFYLKGIYSKQFFIVLLCYSAIIILGLLRTFFYDYPPYHIIRDLTYFIKPVLGFVIGYQAIKNRKISFLKVVVYTALIIAIVHIIIIGLNIIFGSVSSINAIREVGGYISDFEVFALVILLFSNRLGWNMKKNHKFFLFSVIGASIVLYFSRTNLLQFFLLIFGMLGFFKLNFKNLILYFVLLVIGIVGYNIVSDMNPKRSADGIDSFLYKIKNAPYEIYDPYVKNDNSLRFHDRFRSYETKITYLQMKNRKDGGLLWGNGFGSVVNYGTKIATTDGHEVKFAPILHNGYTTVFLKVGFLGLLIFVFSLIYLCFYGKKGANLELNNIKLLINSTGVFMFLSTLVFLGFYLKLDSKSLIIGGLIAYFESFNRINNLS